jgi:hypothetical protein
MLETTDKKMTTAHFSANSIPRTTFHGTKLLASITRVNAPDLVQCEVEFDFKYGEDYDRDTFTVSADIHVDCPDHVVSTVLAWLDRARKMDFGVDAWLNICGDLANEMHIVRVNAEIAKENKNAA